MGDWIDGSEGMNRVELDVGADGVAVLRLESPDGLNSLRHADIPRFIELVDRVAGNGAVRALFLAGGRTSRRASISSRGCVSVSIPATVGGRTGFSRTRRCCATGSAVFGSRRSAWPAVCARARPLGIAAAADFLITDATTRIQLPEVKVGLVPGNGATWFLPRRMGPAAARFYGLTASPMSGKQAVGLGLAQGYAGGDIEGFLAELRKAKGPLDQRRILALLEKRGGTREVLAKGVRELTEKIDRHFGFGQANRGYLGDIFASLERAAAQGDLFARESLAAMRSASAQAVWVTEFLIDTFAKDGFYTEDEARELELKFVQEMTAGFAHLEGALGLSKGFVSGELDSHLDRIVLSDAKGFRTSIPATPVSTGSSLAEDAHFTYEGSEYALPRGAYDCGERSRVLASPGDPDRTVGFRIDLRNSQWSDGRVADELGALRSLMETRMGWRVARRAWLTHPEKFELDMVYPYAWSQRPSVSLDLSSFPVIRRFEDGRINPTRAIFDQLEAQGLLDERHVINIGEDQKDGKNVDVRTYTYREIRREVHRLANVLVDMGVARGDMVVIYMSTDIIGLIAQLAATLVGATYHFVFGAKGPDIFSDTVHNMGAKVIITEDGYRVGDRSRELKKDSVDLALRRYLPKAVFRERLGAALAAMPEELGEEARRIDAAVNERLAGKVTYSRDAMREFLEVVHEAHIKRVVLSSLEGDAGEELKKALRARDEAIRRAKMRVEAAERDERVFTRYVPVLVEALRGVPADDDPGDSGDPWGTASRHSPWTCTIVWMETLEAAGDAIETRHRDWLKNHVRRIVHGTPKPTVETLLTDDQRVGVPEFILRHARRKGVGAGQLETIERQRRVIDRIHSAFEQPHERDEKLIVYDRLARLGLLSRPPLTEGRDILWDDAIRRTEGKLKAEGKDIDEFAAVEMGGGEAAILSYSSGSTGQPKGIISLVGSIVAGAQTMFNSFGLAPHEIHHTSTDYGWIVGPAYALWFPMMEGRSFILQSFAPTPRRLAQVVEDHRVSFLKAGSPIYEAMSKVDGLFDPGQGGFDVRSLQREGAPGICGCAAPYSYPAHARIQAVLGDVAINSLWRTEDFGSQTRDVQASPRRRASVRRDLPRRAPAARRNPRTRGGGGPGADPDRDGRRAPRDPAAAVGEPGDRRPPGGRGRQPGRVAARGDRGPHHRPGAGPQGDDRAAALPGRPAAPHGVADGKQRGPTGARPARRRADRGQVLQPRVHPRMAGQGKGGPAPGPRRRRLGLLGAGDLRPREPGGRPDPDRPGRPGDPQELLRVRAFREHRQRVRPPGQRDDVRERAERAHPFLPESRRDLHPPPHQGPDAGRRGGPAAGRPAQPGPDRSHPDDDQPETQPPGQAGRPGHRLPGGRGGGLRRRGDLPADDPDGEDHVRADQVLRREAPRNPPADAAGPPARRGPGPDPRGRRRVLPRQSAVPGDAQHRRAEGQGDADLPAGPDHRLPRGGRGRDRPVSSRTRRWPTSSRTSPTGSSSAWGPRRCAPASTRSRRTRRRTGSPATRTG